MSAFLPPNTNKTTTTTSTLEDAGGTRRGRTLEEEGAGGKGELRHSRGLHVEIRRGRRPSTADQDDLAIDDHDHEVERVRDGKDTNAATTGLWRFWTCIKA